MSDLPADSTPLDAEEQAADVIISKVFDPSVDVRWRKKEVALAFMQDLMIKGVKTTQDFKKNLAKLDPSYANLDDRTIWRYKEIIANRNIKRLQENPHLKQTTDQMAMKASDMLEMINAELWKIFHAKDQPAKVKVAALKEIRETMNTHLKVMQSLGFVDEAPTKVQQVDADGNVITPLGSSPVEKMVLLQGFQEFMNKRFRDPMPSDKQVELAKKPENANNSAIGLKNEGLQGV